LEINEILFPLKWRGKQEKRRKKDTTHNHLIRVGSAGIGRDQSGGAPLAIPGKLAVLGGAAHGKGENAGRVAVAVAVVAPAAPVPGRPHVDRTFATSALK